MITALIRLLGEAWQQPKRGENEGGGAEGGLLEEISAFGHMEFRTEG